MHVQYAIIHQIHTRSVEKSSGLLISSLCLSPNQMLLLKLSSQYALAAAFKPQERGKIQTMVSFGTTLLFSLELLYSIQIPTMYFL